MITLVNQVFTSNDWHSPVFTTLIPTSPFITTLNENPLSYSEGIEWYTVAGIDYFWGDYAILCHGEINNDLIVAQSKAHLSFAAQANIGYSPLEPSGHNLLVVDTLHRSSSVVEPWLQGGMDADSDGLLNIEEEYRYHTDPYDSDSDDDNLNDYDEINVHSTNPNAWSTDGDILSDKQETDWGYNPLDTDNPIDAQELTYSAWQVNGVTGYVRANHYTAMHYVKVYVQYKNSQGYWTAYFYVGTDYTPIYYGDYYVSWSLLQGYVQMQVNVKAYDSADHYLGSDQQYVTLPGGGGGGGPLPE